MIDSLQKNEKLKGEKEYLYENKYWKKQRTNSTKQYETKKENKRKEITKFSNEKKTIQMKELSVSRRCD